MILPYFPRLLGLLLACFFLLHLVAGLATSLVAPAAVRMAERVRPGVAARCLLALRLFPAGFAVVVVAGLCAPSYLWLEPEAGPELVGYAFLGAALLGLAVWGLAIARGLRAAATSLRYGRNWRHAGRETRLAGESWPVWVIEDSAPFVVLAGIVHPRLLVSRGVVSALSAEQLAAALGHERAHWIARDNLKRLVLLLAPDVVPFLASFGMIERAWARFTEWAADDRAVDGDPRRSLSLAAALVRVARMGAALQPLPLAASLMADGRDLSARVDRLLGTAPPGGKFERGLALAASGAALLLAGGFVAVVLHPATLYRVHWLMERLVH